MWKITKSDVDLCNRTVVHNSNYLYCFPFKGCNGGWPHDAYKYVQRTGGLATEHSYPLNRKGEGKCNKKVPHTILGTLAWTSHCPWTHVCPAWTCVCPGSEVIFKKLEEKKLPKIKELLDDSCCEISF